MSIVAWDGRTLAADRAGMNCDMRFVMPKTAVSANGVVCAWTGSADCGRALAQWYFDGANKAAWPEFQKDKEDWARLIVVEDGVCRYYERQPVSFLVHDPFMAWGSGRDYAMGAMAMGADARRAVEVASQFCISCGLGVDAHDCT